MLQRKLSIVIVTYNRYKLLGRALESILAQCSSETEIIVVDNASTDATSTMIHIQFPSVVFIGNGFNAGPSVARNIGLREASGEFVLFLDDDDVLEPNALNIVEQRFREAGEQFLSSYPVFQFAGSSGYLCCPFKVVDLDDYLLGNIRGDFTPVIFRRLFMDSRLAYPNMKVGAEHLLWWEVAERWGIPTWMDSITRVCDDAPIRLTSAREQIRLAEDHAKAGEATLSRFGATIMERNHKLYALKIFGVATYWILAGKRSKARAVLKGFSSRNLSERLIKYSLWATSYMPVSIVRLFLSYYRRGVHS